MKFPYQTIAHIAPDTPQGLYRISHEAYHQGAGLSSTKVKKALKSRAIFDTPQEDSDAMAFGRAFHAALLEPELYSKKYSKAPLATRKSKAWDDFSRACGFSGLEPMLTHEHIDIMDMVHAIKSHPEYAALSRHDAEIAAISRCPDTGLLIKCKADLFGHAIVDFKSTSDGLRPSEFINSVLKWDYHVSAAFYQDIMFQVLGERLPFIVVPVTKKDPIECEFYTLGDDVIAEGRKLYKGALRRIAKWRGPAPVQEKRMRTLAANARMIYTTVDTLDFIEG